MLERFEFLDGLRGLFVISVILRHTYWSLLTADGFFFGTIGFFLVSSFLLTYRLMLNYENSKNNSSAIFQIALSYLITRFFRIYLPFVLFCSINKLIKMILHFAEAENEQDFTIQLMLLKQIHFGKFEEHLWTVSMLLKYYMLIPLIAFAFTKIKLRKHQILLINLIAIVFLLTIRSYELLTIDEPEKASFICFLPIFLMGSMLAFDYKIFSEYIEANTNTMSNIYLNKLICYSSYFILFVGIRSVGWLEIFREFDLSFNYCALWSVFLFLILIGAPNSLTEFFAGNKILKMFGKNSSGIYLFHSLAMGVSKEIVDWINDDAKFGIKLLNSDQELLIFLISFTFGFAFCYSIEENSIKLGQILIRKLKIQTHLAVRLKSYSSADSNQHTI